MKKYLLPFLFCCLFSVGLSGQECFPDTLLLTSQEQIDNFPIDFPDCTEVLGYVVIREDASGDITNLEGLNQLTFVSKKLIISENTALVNLSGLENIEKVGSFEVINNEALTSFIGLSSLDTIKREQYRTSYGRIWIDSNPSLLNFEGLENLQHVDQYLGVYENDALVSFSGLASLNYAKSLFIRSCPSFQSIGDMPSFTEHSVNYLSVRNCETISNLTGLEALRKLNSINVQGNANLLSLQGLGNLDTLGSLRLESNPILENLDALAGVEVITEYVGLTYNNSITSIEGLQNNADSIGGIYIVGNPQLNSLAGLSSYEVLGGLTIGSNDLLIDFTGLEGLREIRFDAEIYNNAALQNCNGLQNLEVAKRLFHWNNNTALTSFSGLNSLRKVGGLFWIRQHPNVIDLTGFEQLDTIANRFWISNMDSIQSLNGLNGLEYLGGTIPANIGVSIGQFHLGNNPLLSDISAIEGANTDDLGDLVIFRNPMLEVCSYPNLCAFALSGRPVIIYDNGLGCNNKGQFMQGCLSNLPHSSLVGTVSADVNEDCDITNDDPIPNIMISFENDSLDWQINTNETGEYWMPLLLGEWTMNAISPSSFWTPCLVDTLLEVNSVGDTIVVDFPLQPQGDCSYIEWDLTMENLRICDSSTFVIDYCNYGTSIADDLMILVNLDSFLTFQTASIPHTIDAEGNVIFFVDNLDLFDCDQISFSAFVDCDSLDIWDVQCVEVNLFSEELCPSDSLWDGSIVKVEGYCENDSIYFELENIGTGDMQQSEQFRVEIVIDDIILFLEVDEYQLEVDAIELLSFPTNNSTGMRIEVDQSPGFPGDEQASAVVANCNAIENNEIYFLLPNGEDGDPFNEIFCEPVVNSFDPNDKSAIPEGLTYEHLIDKDWELDYQIRFQNTGNAVANKVVIRDAISDSLDLTTLKVKGASHSFTWELMPGRELIFTFDNIMLPDSNANEPASHGFVYFSILPKTTLLPGAVIENTAGIYFDFNEPIITNTVKHKLRKPMVTTSEHQDFCIGGLLMGIPIWSDTTFQLLSEGDLYDSLHFLHLDVVSNLTSNVFVEIPVGEMLEGVVIDNDTSFVVNYQSQAGCDSLVTYYVAALVNIDEPSDEFSEIVVYPNPVKEKLFVLHNENEFEQSWRLYNTLGQEMWKMDLSLGVSFPAIDVEPFNSGVYLLELRTEEGKQIWKLMIE